MLDAGLTEQQEPFLIRSEFPSGCHPVKLFHSSLCVVVFLRICVSQLINKPPGVEAPAFITQGQSGSPLTQASGPSADHLSPSPQPRDSHV